jgi:glyoxylase-like metal-dependent hydrolase (beta-lactamase superfamily II)
MHLDHTGAVAALDRFPNAQVLVTRSEYEWAQAPDVVAGHDPDQWPTLKHAPEYYD